MRNEYDFSKAKRTSEVPHLAALQAEMKHEIENVMIDRDVITAFKATGNGWQNRLNDALRDWLRTHPNLESA
ncbi:MAG: BrnA antitoxin family protein [Methylococcaceae bacterium]